MNLHSFALRQSMFFIPEHSGRESAWTEHAPFAFWLIDMLRPKNFVELGTHAGFSYFCFCQAVARLQTNTICCAVDTWLGDEHAGFYEESVFQNVKEINGKYEEFSHLMRISFDEAQAQFPDQSISLLHIDGRHFYDDVKHDYEYWLPKLAGDAIVLFHDIEVHERDFGVRKLFDCLKIHHTSFEFLHGHGLGVLAPGAVPVTMEAFFAQNPVLIREFFSALGFATAGRHQLQGRELLEENKPVLSC